MRFGIERHRLRALSCGDAGESGVLVRGVLMKDGDTAFPEGVEYELGFRIEGRGVNVVSDRVCCYDLASIGVCDGHQMIPATDKNPAVCCVKGHAGWRFARSHRPAVCDFERLRIDLNELAFIFKVDPHVPSAIGY